jgi:hypothetical protein
MKELKKLIDVKSIVTLSLTVLFIILSIMKIIDGDAVMTIYTTVIAFYFGTQYQKKADETTDTFIQGTIEEVKEPIGFKVGDVDDTTK